MEPMKPMKPMKPMEPMKPATPWWPDDLGQPDTSGAQNDLRYAYFASRHRLAVSRGGKAMVYDTGEYELEFCKLRRDFVKSRVRWIISRGPPRSRPGKSSDKSST